MEAKGSLTYLTPISVLQGKLHVTVVTETRLQVLTSLTVRQTN